MTITTIEDLRAEARRAAPRMFYDYAASGSYTETTLERNSSDFDRIQFRQRVAVDMDNRTLAARMAGEDVAMPLALAPIGSGGMMRANGEILAAKAAEEFGVPYTLSTMSICSIEEVAKHASKPFWFQLYFMRDHDFSRKLVQRAKDAGCSALVLTLDLQLLAQRHRDVKNGLSTPPKLTIRNFADMAMHPRWCMGMLGTRNRNFGNIVGHAVGVNDLGSLSSWTSHQFDPRLDWDGIKRIQDWWGGKLILKGILDVEDAKLAARTGADAIIVSNHGGRQLDGAPSAISILPEIASSVGKDIEVWMDGGISTGQNLLKAWALGARGVMMGRGYVWGMAAGGKAGVAKALEIIRNEADTTMALCGHRDIGKVDRSILRESTVPRA